MSKQDGTNRRARCTVEVKLEAVRLVKAGQEASLTAPSAWGSQADPEPLGGRCQGSCRGS